MKKIASIFLLGIVLSSCGGSGSKETSVKDAPVKEHEFVQECTFTIDTENAQANWTAFKLENKTGVNGAFTSIMVDSISSDSPEKILEGLRASIQTGSVSTQDEARDKKIVNSFFYTMLDSAAITADFANVNISSEKEENVSGSVEVTFKMNGVTKMVPAKFNFDGKMMKVMGTVIVPEFGAQSSLDALNKVCEEKHRGEGSKAVTWPDVQFSLSAPLLKSCK